MKKTLLFIVLFSSVFADCKEYYVGWENYETKMVTLAAQIRASEWEFDQILCIARGGLLVGTRLSHLLDKPLAVIMSSSYGGEGGREHKSIRISEIAMVSDSLAKRVLLLDDLVDSGETLAEIRKLVEKKYPGTEIKTAVLFKKPLSIVEPDYWVEAVDQDTWITQPFEK